MDLQKFLFGVPDSLAIALLLALAFQVFSFYVFLTFYKAMDKPRELYTDWERFSRSLVRFGLVVYFIFGGLYILFTLVAFVGSLLGGW